VAQAIERHGVSERRACRILSHPRGTQRYRPILRPDEDLLTQRIISLACQYGRYGYRRIAVMVNRTKASLFTVEERIAMIKEVVTKYPNVKVDSWSGLLVDYCKTNGVSAIVKGLRAVSDFDYELQMAQMNLQLKGVDTLFMATTPAYSFLSSSLLEGVMRGVNLSEEG